MADVRIDELPALAAMEDDDLVPVEHDGTAMSMSGTVLHQYVYECVEDDVETIAGIIAVGPQGDDGVSPTLSSSKSGKVTTIYYTDADHTSQTVLATINDGQDGTGIGDMVKATYDTDDSGVVDDAERLGGQLPDYYMPASAAPNGAENGVAELDSYGKVLGSQVFSRMAMFTTGGNANINANDENRCIVCSNADATVKLLAANAYPDGYETEVIRWGANTVTITAESGVTLNGVNGGSKTIKNQYGSAVLKCISSADKAWLIQGDI